jgi:hypothetical protein
MISTEDALLTFINPIGIEKGASPQSEYWSNGVLE